MRKFVGFLLLAALLLGLVGCGGNQPQTAEIRPEDVYEVYLAAGYNVDIWNPPTDNDLLYHTTVTARDLEGHSITFHFCNSAADAAALAEERQWNWAVWLVTLAMFRPTWLTTTTYGNIEIEYDHASIYQPFAKMIR